MHQLPDKAMLEWKNRLSINIFADFAYRDFPVSRPCLQPHNFQPTISSLVYVYTYPTQKQTINKYSFYWFEICWIFIVFCEWCIVCEDLDWFLRWNIDVKSYGFMRDLCMGWWGDWGSLRDPNPSQPSTTRKIQWYNNNVTSQKQIQIPTHKTQLTKHKNIKKFRIRKSISTTT